MKTRIVVMVGFTALISPPSFSQMSMRMSGGPDGQFTMTATFDGSRFSGPAVTGAPYCGDQLTETTQTLADGTRISQPSRSTRMCRDSSGRTRTERPFMLMGPVSPEPIVLIAEITDPVAGYHYILDLTNRVAHRTALQPFPQRPSFAPPAAGRPYLASTPPIPPNATPSTRRLDYSNEALGTAVIDGITVEGRLTTTTHPAGAMGNDRPIVTMSEVWFSPELRLMILTRNNDPRSGEHVTRWENLSRDEPDPGLFQIPPGYDVVDETGPFTITIKRP